MSNGMVKASEVALALPTRPIERLEDLRVAIARLMDQKVNVISPVAQIDHLMPMHQISLRAVVIDSTVDDKGNGPECYFDPRFCKAGEVALGKNALSKLMGAAGVQIAGKRRLDDRSDPNYCEIEMVLAMRDFDGTYRQIIATKEMDLRPGAPETMKPEYKDNRKTGRMVAMEDTAVADKRRHIQSHAETKAIERGIRLLFALKQKYTKDELSRPFVIPKLVSNLDTSDPEVKTAVIQHALYGDAALFGPPRGGEPVRTLREAAPPPALAPAAQERAEAATDDGNGAGTDAADTGDFDMPTFPEPAIIVCLCPCGDQKHLTEQVAAMTQERVGSVRCRECFPGAGFDYARHKDLRTLGYKTEATKNLTAEDVRKANERQKEGAPAGGRK